MCDGLRAAQEWLLRHLLGLSAVRSSRYRQGRRGPSLSTCPAQQCFSNLGPSSLVRTFLICQLPLPHPRGCSHAHIHSWPRGWLWKEEGDGAWAVRIRGHHVSRCKETVSCALNIPTRCTPLHSLQSSLVCLVMSDGHRHEATQAVGISPKGRGVERKKSFGFRRSELNSQRDSGPLGLSPSSSKLGVLIPPERCCERSRPMGDAEQMLPNHGGAGWSPE